MYDTCILCRKGVDTGQRYYVRTDVKAAITDLLLKIPRNLAHLFDFLPSITTSSVELPFCCRPCKRLVEKRQKLVENIDVVENEMRSRRFGQAARSLELGVESSSTSHANPSATCTAAPCQPRVEINFIASFRQLQHLALPLILLWTATIH